MKACALCGEKKKPEDFKIIPYFLQEDPERKKTWCRVCQSLWLKKKREMKEPLSAGFIKIDNRSVTVTFS